MMHQQNVGSQRHGFTVIEVMLFLAISGLMMLGLFVGINGSINNARYNDATRSFRAFMSDQYGKVTAIQNDRAPLDVEACRFGGAGAVTGARRAGASNCIVVGQFISTPDGKSFTSRTVAAKATISAAAKSATSVRDVLQAQDAFLTQDTSEEYTATWGTSTTAGGSVAPGYSILIVRSPTTSLASTFMKNTAITFEQMLAGDTTPGDMHICVHPNGLVPDSTMTGVTLSSESINSSGVALLTSSDASEVCR